VTTLRVHRGLKMVPPVGLEPTATGLEELGLFLLGLHHLSVSLWRL
jgi:hypothetical protein